MNDLISRQAAIEIIQSMYPGMPRVPWRLKNWQKQYEPYIRLEKEIKGLPTADVKPIINQYNNHPICPFCGRDLQGVIKNDG